jgi:predicted site-specific integrase-resolvase
MNPHTTAPHIPSAPLVPAKAIANKLGVSTRYVHLLADRGEIPVVKFGKGCTRFDAEAVFRAVGLVKGGKA